MPGSIVFRPIEANLTHNTELIGKMDPYVQFVLGNHKLRTNVCRKGGKHPMWDDSVTVPSNIDNPTCLIEIKDKDLLIDDRIGSFELDLREVETQGSLKKWFPIFHRNKPAGEILLEAVFSAEGFGTSNLNQPIGGLLTGHNNTTIVPTSTVLTAPNQKYTAPIGQVGLQSGFLSGGVPLQTQGVTPNPGSKSLSEQFAEEALLRGIDPLHSHSVNLGFQQPLPTGVVPGGFPLNTSHITNKERNLPVHENVGGFIPQTQSTYLPQGNLGFSQGGISNVPLGQTGLLPAQGGFVSGGVTNLNQNEPILTQTGKHLHTVKDQHAIPMQHGQFTPVGTGIGSDYLTNNVIASNMGTSGKHLHHDQHTFGHGHHDEPLRGEHGSIVKEGLNPTTQGPKGTVNAETFDRKIHNF